MRNEGWISIYRKILDNPLWEAEPFTRAQAWIDLLLLANHSEGKIIVRDNIITVKRGQVGWSQQRLALRWKWSRTKVRGFLKYLENEQQVIQHKNFVSSLVTIINYDKYQKKDSKMNSRRTARRQQEDTNNKENKKNKENNIYKKSKKSLKKEKQLDMEILTTEEAELLKITEVYNLIFGKNTRSTSGFEKNYSYWRKIHSKEKISKAIENARKDKFWKDKMTLTILFRRKNSNGEAVDYVEDISSREPGTLGDIAGI